jgi:hypothetical protein
MTRDAWDRALEAYFAEHDDLLTDADARGPGLLRVDRSAGALDRLLPEPPTGRAWLVTQTLHDPQGDHDWAIEAVADLDASDDTGELVLRTLRMGPLGSLS